MRELLESFEDSCMLLRLECTNTGEKTADEMVRRCDRWRVARVAPPPSGRRKLGRREEDPRPKAPPNDRTDREVRDTDGKGSLIRFEPPIQVPEIAGDRVAPITSLPRLIPGKERV